MASDGLGVVKQTQELLTSARRFLPQYGRLATPVSDHDVLKLASALCVQVEVFTFQSSDRAMLLPSLQGRLLIALNQRYGRSTRAFALRHELAHVLAGDAEGFVYLSEEGDMSESERTADLFAMADIVSGSLLAFKHADNGFANAGHTIAKCMRPFTRDWSCERRRDRIALRALLYDAELRSGV